MANALSRLLGFGDIWIVPLVLPCAQCGGSMKKGRLAVRPSFWTFSFRFVGDDVYYVESESGAEVKIVGSLRTELAYRCPTCATVVIVNPGVVGRKAEP